MKHLRSRLPPAGSLVVFEAAARHASFTRAADELGVTQAAVSRQIHQLESNLGLMLFRRLHRALELTAEGERLLRAVTIGLGHIASVIDEMRREQAAPDVAIASSVTFASYWLMSRIAQFRASFPEIDVRMTASATTGDMLAAGADLAIRYGSGAWQGFEAERLFGNDIFAVCAPDYVARIGTIEKLSDLRDATLLHLEQFDRNWVSWESWLAAFGAGGLLSGNERRKDRYFDNYMLLLHAAVRGEGVALCGARVAEDLIARGELVQPVRAALRSEYAFWLVRPVDRPLRPAAVRLFDWLLSEAAGRRRPALEGQPES